jgi:predicted ester cyclase
MADEKRAFIRKFWECVTSADWDRLADMYDDNVVYHGTGGGCWYGRQAVVDPARSHKSAFVDLTIDIDFLLLDGDFVFSIAYPRSMRSDAQAEVAVHGRAVDAKWVMHVVRLLDGRIAEEWEILDGAELATQLRTA